MPFPACPFSIASFTSSQQVSASSRSSSQAAAAMQGRRTAALLLQIKQAWASPSSAIVQEILQAFCTTGSPSVAPAAGQWHQAHRGKATSAQAAAFAGSQHVPLAGRGTHEVKVSIKAFERRYVDAASMAIRDLAFITFQPSAVSCCKA